MRTSRADALTVTCPRCDAPAGAQCTSQGRPVSRAHQERHDEYRRQPKPASTRERRVYDVSAYPGDRACPLCEGTGWRVDSWELVKEPHAVEHVAAVWTEHGWADRTIPAGMDVSTRYTTCECR